MDRIMVRSRKDPKRMPFIVFQQGDGYPLLNDRELDEEFSRDDLRTAAENLTANLYWGDSRQKFEE